MKFGDGSRVWLRHFRSLILGFASWDEWCSSFIDWALFFLFLGSSPVYLSSALLPKCSFWNVRFTPALKSDIMSSQLSRYFKLLIAVHEALWDLMSPLVLFPTSPRSPLLCSGKVCQTVPHICVFTYVAVSSQDVISLLSPHLLV